MVKTCLFFYLIAKKLYRCTVCKNNPFKTECIHMLQDFKKNDISIAPPDGANAVLNTDRMFTELELLIYFTASKGNCSVLKGLSRNPNILLFLTKLPLNPTVQCLKTKSKVWHRKVYTFVQYS